MEDKNSQQESFRDSIATINEEGSRQWIYPKKPKGRFYEWRKYVSYFLLALLFAGPFIRIGGEPFLLFNVVERKFIIFGQIFWPQDFYLFVLAMLNFIVFIILFTVVFGRLFCGWVCPQTIFMEMVFRRIEYLIEGDYKKQEKLNKQPWNAEKIQKKGLKFVIFFIISFIISNTFLAYIIGSDELISVITDPPSEHIQGLTSILIFTGVFYFVFAWFREQVCIVVCPYGRLQGVMLDRNSVVVAYDHERGEDRGKLRKDEDRSATTKGDCIDCKQCVHVCPTGIDIRNGTQLECINCTACIDACDEIMDTVGFERGLIRYASEAEIADKKKWKLSGRSLAYSIVLVLLLGVFGFLLMGRTEVDSTLLRAPNILYQKLDDDKIQNIYNLKIINKTNEDMDLDIEILNYDAEIKLNGLKELHIEKQGKMEAVVFVILNNEDVVSMKTILEVGIIRDGEVIDKFKTSFMGPIK